MREKRSITVLTSLLLIFCLLILPLQALAGTTWQVATEEKDLPLATGVRYSSYNINGEEYIQSVRLLRINPGEQYTVLETILSNGSVAVEREKPSVMAAVSAGEGRAVVAAVNGDFYSTQVPYLPNGLQIRNGELLVSPQNFPAMGIDSNNKPFIGIPVMDARITITKEVPGEQQEVSEVVHTYPINRVNRERGTDMMVLYTPAFASSTMTNDFGVEVVLGDVELPLQAGKVYQAKATAVIKGRGDNPIPRDGFVLSGHGKARDILNRLEPGDIVELVVGFTDERWHGVSQAIGGREILLQGGEVALTPDMQDPLITARHPRTAVGILENGELEIVIADGRQPGYSDGMSLFELAEFMKARGIVTALNLDGGGSTVLAGRNPGEMDLSILNRIAGSQERAVTNGLAVYTTAPKGEFSHLYILPGIAKVYRGSRVQFALRAQDNYYNPTAVPGNIEWQVSGDLGYFETPGIFTAAGVGRGEITAGSGDVKAAATVTVVEEIYDLKISPAATVMQPGESRQFTVTAYDTDGSMVYVDGSLFQWEAVEGLEPVDAEKGVFKAVETLNNASLKVSLGGKEAVVMINPALELVAEGAMNTGETIVLTVSYNGAPVEGAVIRQVLPAASIGQVTASALNFRTGPGMEHNAAALLMRGSILQVLEKVGEEWVKVRLDDGREGYVAAEYITVQEGSPTLGQTGAEGRIIFSPALPGRYVIEATKEGYPSATVSLEIK